MTQCPDSSASLSVIIPVKNPDAALLPLLQSLASYPCQIILVGASSKSETGAGVNLREQIASLGVHSIQAPPSRGGQIAAGIAMAKADWVWVLHADSTQIDEALAFLLDLANQSEPAWGRFDVSLQGQHPGLKWVARAMNLRSRWSRICTGDQGMFFHRQLLADIGGFPEQKLMEDIEVSARLRRRGRFLAPRVRIVSSGQRWDRDGFCATIFAMWRWRYRYFRGVSADQLYDQYYGDNR